MLRPQLLLFAFLLFVELLLFLLLLSLHLQLSQQVFVLFEVTRLGQTRLVEAFDLLCVVIIRAQVVGILWVAFLVVSLADFSNLHG